MAVNQKAALQLSPAGDLHGAGAGQRSAKINDEEVCCTWLQCPLGSIKRTSIPGATEFKHPQAVSFPASFRAVRHWPLATLVASVLTAALYARLDCIDRRTILRILCAVHLHDHPRLHLSMKGKQVVCSSSQLPDVDMIVPSTWSLNLAGRCCKNRNMTKQLAPSSSRPSPTFLPGAGRGASCPVHRWQQQLDSLEHGVGMLLQEVLLELGVGLIIVWVHHCGKAELDNLLAEDGDGESEAVPLLVDILDLDPRLHRSEQARHVFRPKW